ncbi:MAG: hypothetical protein A3H72_01270 [Candidatus Doudnabacteria bacterium RIFCSPLOWO2_02_FULL_48_8]|uniref:Uncharacterized protein n=1 Tax=Candidatus Doudnabacteria bacterium RIFCSPHIGHO2_01_FULL_46_24 TaxID=1817825 RepID=A0A1F5NUW2_9BACT|nr:MAG: hypothetical protein A2720_02820 [Candidatus Doudnabacteria bacterium RIFCSPHIGHO2_01_FULL_46_24]OGE95027.1 MAG: hypothetical protein A3H72_01270 [Candidatus Doudnabacteria bacterium RIFCSPLOWO2_02_FULL_48_8]OGE95932.1 MAG: hypothetical protein A3E98_00595 [Candidatus Doudnabacteria bacterium RIFCSPHIGHO2_12_FULL_48_11]
MKIIFIFLAIALFILSAGIVIDIQLDPVYSSEECLQNRDEKIIFGSGLLDYLRTIFFDVNVRVPAVVPDCFTLYRLIPIDFLLLAALFTSMAFIKFRKY